MPKRLIVRGPGMRGPAGRDGSNTVPTDEAFAGLVEDATSDTRAALDALIGDGGNLGTTGYDIVLLLGQSNMQGGTGGTVSPVLDVVSPDVWTFGATGTYAGQIVQASDPLAHRTPGNVIGPGMEFARWYATTTRRRVLLVPAAEPGTAFGSGTLRWDTAYPDNSTSLYNLAIHQAEAALTAAGADSRLIAVLWSQGESDAIAGLDGTAYRTHLESLIDGLRDRLDSPDLPFVIGSMLPEFVSSYVSATTRAAIDTAHRGVPARKAHTAFVEGLAGNQVGDDLHYSQTGQRAMGRAMVAGLSAAQANATPADLQPVNPPTPPAPPTGVSVSDNFNRADSSTTLGVTPVGALTWEAIGGTFGITANQAYPATVTDANAFAVVNTGETDGTVTCTFATGRDTGTLLVWRYVDPDNYYGLYLAPTAQAQMYKKVGGVFSAISSEFGASADAAYSVEVAGSTFTAYKAGVQIGTPVTDSALTVGTRVGVCVGSTSPRFDDFGFESS